jgi:molybdopterin-guanine dinucleotide biosynthesis protein A
MGRDKTMLALRGQRVVALLAGYLRETCGRCVLIGRSEQREQFSSACPDAFVADLVPGGGPLGGLHAALMHCDDDVLLLACDLPLMNAALLQRLNRTWSPPEMKALLPRTGPDFCEPTCAIWGRVCQPAVEAAVQRKRWSLRWLAQDVGAQFLDVSDAERKCLRNLNTPAELCVTEGVEFVDR